MKKDKKTTISILEQLLSRPWAKDILKEWARHIMKKTDPAMFANLFLEMMRDPESHGLRRDATAFLTFAASRDWDELVQDLTTVADKGVMKAFAQSYAPTFYEGWKAMVMHQVEDYFGQTIRNDKKSKRKTG